MLTLCCTTATDPSAYECTSDLEWLDDYGDGCTSYDLNRDWCEFAPTYVPNGALDATDTCCVCGGGSKNFGSYDDLWALEVSMLSSTQCVDSPEVWQRMLAAVDTNETAVQVSIECGTGNFLNSSRCSPCLPGTYRTSITGTNLNATAGTACLACPSGTVSLGASEDCICKEGYEVSGGVACAACGVGTFKGFNGSGACSPCQAGTYLNVTGGTACVSCPARTVPSAGASRCFPCPSGSFSNSLGQLCVSCPEGSASSEGSASINDCTCSSSRTGLECLFNVSGRGSQSNSKSSAITRLLVKSQMLADLDTFNNSADTFRRLLAFFLGLDLSSVQIVSAISAGTRRLLQIGATDIEVTTDLPTDSKDAAKVSLREGAGFSTVVTSSGLPSITVTAIVEYCGTGRTAAQDKCLSCLIGWYKSEPDNSSCIR